MNRRIQLLIGLMLITLFAAICAAEIIDPRAFGLSRGEVIEKVDNGVPCFGEESQYDAQVVLDFYREYQLPITTTYLSNQLTKGERAQFIYWGSKRDIESPLQSIDDETKYFSDVKIALVSIDSWVTWYYILFQGVKWMLMLSGIVLLLPNRTWKRKTN